LAKQKSVAGLGPRLAAARRLAGVLRGESFAPLTAADIDDSRDRALANRLVTTALRYHGPLSRVIASLLAKGLPKKAGLFEPVLRISLAQLYFLPDLGPYSALFLAAEAMRADPKSQHLTKLINAVLREAQRRDPPMMDAATLFPPTLSDTWRAAYGETVLAGFGRALLEGAPLDLTLKGDNKPSPGDVPVLADTVRLNERDRAVADLPGYSEGHFWVQDAAAAIPARLIHCEPGARVLDLGAAPGGKTAQLIKAGYAVTALDRDPERMTRLAANLERLRYTAELVTADALDYAPATPFDAILLDAPCSATGTFRRHPEVVWHRNPADVAGRVAVQRRLVSASVKLLKAGGTLVYCVCSLEPEEGEQQAAWA
jgi:16S rRNA (cytosine967-C5)-methyltransferase